MEISFLNQKNSVYEIEMIIVFYKRNPFLWKKKLEKIYY